MNSDILLPDFEMDCRDWLVITPEESGLDDEVGGAPLVAVLSTAVVNDGELHSVSGVVSVVLLDDEPPDTVAGCGVAAELVDCGGMTVRYLVPAPGGRLGLLVEFARGRLSGAECGRRVRALMDSFRWAV